MTTLTLSIYYFYIIFCWTTLRESRLSDIFSVRVTALLTGTDWSLLGKHGPTFTKEQEAPAKDVCIFLQQAAAYIAQPEPDITRLGMSRQLFHFIYLPVIARYYSHSKKGGKKHF